MRIAYCCDGCEKSSFNKNWIFNCIECDVEICESCMYSWATCKQCASKHTDEFLKTRFDKSLE